MPEVDILKAAMEFYSIQAIDAKILLAHKYEPFRKSHERWMQDFEEYKSEYIRNMAHMIYDYTVIAVAGEMRHAQYKSGYYCPDYEAYGLGREAAWRVSRKYNPISLLKVASHLFNASEWESGYGGEAWANIANAGLHYGKWSDVVFIDHCIDLSHNSSVYFDKTGNGVLILYDTDEYQEFLNFKYKADPDAILTDLIRTKALDALLTRALNIGLFQYIGKIQERRFYSRDNVDDSATLVLTYEERAIEWGDVELYDTLMDSGKKCFEKYEESDYDEEEDEDEDEDEEDEEENGYGEFGIFGYKVVSQCR